MSLDINQIWARQELIGQRGLKQEYLTELIRVLGLDEQFLGTIGDSERSPIETEALFLLVTAPTFARSVALNRVLGAE